MDAAATVVAAHVQRHVLGYTQELAEALGFESAQPLVITPVVDRQTLIRVGPPAGPFRYFLVDVKGWSP